MLIGLDLGSPTPDSLPRGIGKPARTASAGTPAILQFATARDSLDGWVKRGLELMLCLVLLIPALPVMLLAGMLIKLTSRGPALYTQTRVGRHGALFSIYKLRTMIHNCESLTGPRWAIPGDPRITPVGQFLRRSHIDELPQLWNVIRGDMSLIGPRPERPEFVEQLSQAIGQYEDRLAVLPGITGLAQIQLPPDTDLDSVRRKLACDLHYIQHGGPWLDCAILLATVARAAGIPFAAFGLLLRVPSWRGLTGLPEDRPGYLRKLAQPKAA